VTDETKVFSEKLQELIEYSGKNGDRLPAGKIQEAFEGLSLDDEKLQMVYAYMDQMGVQVYDPSMEDVSHDGSHQSALETYLEELESITDLPRDLELKLFHMAADGDKEAGGTLVSRYLSTACDLAGEFEGKGLKVETEDLIQEANLGLLMAVNELEREESLAAYRVRLLNRVTTYLEERVREMEEELRGESKVVSRMNRLAQSVHELEEQLEHKPSIEELSAYLDLTTQEIRDLLRVGGEKLTIEDI